MAFLRLFSFDGLIGRLGYAAVGFAGVTLKQVVDILVAGAFRAQWTPFRYILPLAPVSRITHMTPGEQAFLATLLVVSIPFAWLGVACTVKRLRAIGWPLWLAALFFVPIVNFVFFALLCVVPDVVEREGLAAPSSADRPWLENVMPTSAFGSATLAVLVTALFSMAAVWLAANVVGSYGWGLFVAAPFCQGMLAVLIAGYRVERSIGYCLLIAALSALLGALALIGVAIEGVICLVMAAPLVVPFALLGGVVGYFMQRRNTARPPSAGSGGAPSVAAFLVVLLASPAIMAAQPILSPVDPVYAVTTSVDVNAPPARVWSNVVTFAPLDPPTELLFRAGVAYPMSAQIVGHGRGAVRLCTFSTGSFVEPITQWSAPRVLAFEVVSNPEPMRELSPYPDLETRHLQGYLVAQRGQFVLEPLPGGRTRLIGTTWYRHSLWPAEYWRLWSDALIHQIHRRVLEHIKTLAERRSTRT